MKTILSEKELYAKIDELKKAQRKRRLHARKLERRAQRRALMRQYRGERKRRAVTPDRDIAPVTICVSALLVGGAMATLPVNPFASLVLMVAAITVVTI